MMKTEMAGRLSAARHRTGLAPPIATSCVPPGPSLTALLHVPRAIFLVARQDLPHRTRLPVSDRPASPRGT
jgi:hypothetical protein